MIFVCIMFLGLTRGDINLFFFSVSDYDTRTRINPIIFQEKRMFRIFSEKYCFFVSKICRVFVFFSSKKLRVRRSQYSLKHFVQHVRQQ